MAGQLPSLISRVPLHVVTYPDEARLPELMLRGVTLSAFITLLCIASKRLSGLKVGLTFASAIPAADIEAVLSRVVDADKLEKNMVQTPSPAAGTLSSVFSACSIPFRCAG